MPASHLHRRALTAVLTAVAALACASPAFGAQRYAAPTSTDVLGPCTSLAPCRLDHAVNGASTGDEVIVESGDYDVTYAVAPLNAVDVHGEVGKPRPRLIGSSTLVTDVLNMDAGGMVSHLYIEAHAPLTKALELEGGAVGEDLEVYATGGAEAVSIKGAPSTTMLRDSVVRGGSSTSLSGKDPNTGPSGPVKVLNVTVPGGVKSKQLAATMIVRNTIAGTVEGDKGGLIAVDHSNFDAGASLAYTDAGGNQSATPLFRDAAAGDLRPRGGSPTIDAGTGSDADLGVADPNGRSRTFGLAPDIGAYEHSAADDPAAGSDSTADPATTTPGLAPPSNPVLGSRVGVGVSDGKVKVRRPGSKRFVTLQGDASTPVNSIIDATRGVVTLTSARDSKGTPQTGEFSGGQFKVVQKRTGDKYTELVLTGGSFRACAKPRSRKAQSAKARFVRRLWGRDRRGKFRTRGRRAQATVRGTHWLTEDRCDGTRFVVKEGAIDVRANGSRKSRLVRAGKSYLVRAPKR